MLSLSVTVILWHYREAVFFVSFYVISVGEGGHKPSVLTFAADHGPTKCGFHNGGNTPKI